METQGAVGIENELSVEEIRKATQYFSLLVLQSRAQNDLKTSSIRVKFCRLILHQLLSRQLKLLIRLRVYKKERKMGSFEIKKIREYLMTGISYMIPICIIGGMFFAISIGIGGTYDRQWICD